MWIFQLRVHASPSVSTGIVPVPFYLSTKNALKVESSDLQKSPVKSRVRWPLGGPTLNHSPPIVGIKPSDFCRIRLGLCSHHGGGNADRSYRIGEALWKVAKLRGALLGYVGADTVCLGLALALMGARAAEPQPGELILWGRRSRLRRKSAGVCRGTITDVSCPIELFSYKRSWHSP
jgi:hypothetical protein